MEVHWEFRNKDALLGINHEAPAIFVNGVQLPLARMEIEFILVLARANGRTVTSEFVADSMRAGHVDTSPYSLPSCVARVRKKMGVVHADAKGFIQNVYGTGYKMVSAMCAVSTSRAA